MMFESFCLPHDKYVENTCIALIGSRPHDTFMDSLPHHSWSPKTHCSDQFVYEPRIKDSFVLSFEVFVIRLSCEYVKIKNLLKEESYPQLDLIWHALIHSSTRL